jgi:hypothetical protein
MTGHRLVVLHRCPRRFSIQLCHCRSVGGESVCQELLNLAMTSFSATSDQASQDFQRSNFFSFPLGFVPGQMRDAGTNRLTLVYSKQFTVSHRATLVSAPRLPKRRRCSEKTRNVDLRSLEAPRDPSNHQGNLRVCLPWTFFVHGHSETY